jgi:hypothetical protein
MNLNKLGHGALRAAMRGGTAAWGEWGSSNHHVRYMEPIPPSSRRRCHCGCKQRATHVGKCNGIALIDGCELRVARWAAAIDKSEK